MIKYFCDDCGKEVVIDQHPLGMEIEDGGEGVDIIYHEMGIEIDSYDRRSDERTRHHQCKLCHVKDNGEESFYYEEDTTYEYLGIFL
jgi:hypothetical protein|tara:strand:- start:468 stop:728 length:261 start_codon:yes stop_codon:yes gene_type:complete